MKRQNYLNGISKNGRVMCKRNLPKLKYNYGLGVWTLYKTEQDGTRTKIQFHKYDGTHPDIVYLRNWFVITEKDFTRAKGTGLAGHLFKVKDRGEFVSETDLNNLRYFAKYKARYEYFKLYKRIYGNISEDKIMVAYERDMGV